MPAAHVVHAVWPLAAANVPTVQLLQAVAAAADENEPGEQLVQTLEVLAPLTVLNVPAKHAVQVAELVAPAAVE